MNPLLATVAVLLVAATPPPSPVPAAGSFSVQVALVYTNGTHNTPVASAVADILLINATNATLVENFTLEDNVSFNETDLGANLTGVTDVVIFPHNLSGYPNASAQPVDVNVTGQTEVTVTITYAAWSLNVTPGSLPSPFPPPPDLPTIPLFVALAGVGIAAFVAWIGYRGFRQMYSVFSNGEL